MVKKKRKGTTNLDLTGKRFGKLVVLKDLDEELMKELEREYGTRDW